MLLGLLKQKDLTGYEIKQYLNLSHAESWAGIKTGSIYYALKTMDEKGLISVKSVESVGNRSRTIYSITTKGEAFFKNKLENTLSKTDLCFPSALYTSLTFLGELPHAVAIKSINSHIKKLEEELENWEIGEKLKQETQNQPLPKYMKALFKNGYHHIKANIEFLEEIKELLPETSFEVDLPPLSHVKREGDQ